MLFWYLFPSLLFNSGNKNQNNPLVNAQFATRPHILFSMYMYIDGSVKGCRISSRDDKVLH